MAQLENMISITAAPAAVTANLLSLPDSIQLLMYSAALIWYLFAIYDRLTKGPKQ